MKTLKTLLASFLFVVLLLAARGASAQWALDISTNGGEISVTGYTDSPTNVVIPGYVTTIAFGAFQGSGTLTNVEIPASVTNIQDYAFSGCHSLLALTVDAGNPNYASSNGVVFSADFTTMDIYPAGSPATFYTVPSGVNNINDDAFSENDLLQGVSLPGTLTNLGQNGFAFCYALTNVTVPNGVVSIGDGCFSSCFDLAGLSLPASVTNIGEGLLINDSDLKAGVAVDPLNTAYTAVGGVLYNKSVTVLYAYPPGLTNHEYAIPDGVTNIVGEAFWAAPLTNITLPASLTTIPNSAFYVATSLKTITIPATVTNIGMDAFSSCYQLTSVFVQGDVASVGSDAFGNCTKLTGVFFEGNAPVAEDCSVFNADANLSAVYYLPGAMGWGTSWACVPTVNWGDPAPEIISVPGGFSPTSGQFGFALSGSSNALVSVQASTNLTSWSTIASVPLTNGVSYFVDGDTNSYPHRFYRIHIP